jgi:hypothetical protein
MDQPGHQQYADFTLHGQVVMSHGDAWEGSPHMPSDFIQCEYGDNKEEGCCLQAQDLNARRIRKAKFEDAGASPIREIMPL